MVPHLLCSEYKYPLLSYLNKLETLSVFKLLLSLNYEKRAINRVFTLGQS
jgi:hypothetical protein